MQTDDDSLLFHFCLSQLQLKSPISRHDTRELTHRVEEKKNEQIKQKKEKEIILCMRMILNRR